MEINTKHTVLWISIFIVFLNCIVVDAVCSGNRCGTCIVSGADCLWCKQKGYNGTRCATESQLLSRGCTDIVRHPTSTIIKTKDEPLRDGNKIVTPIQLQPQEVTIKLVPHEDFRWEFQYRVAENFPVDIYFLVDPSYTMRTLRDQLSNLAIDIGDSIAKLTSDFRFGYGTSMDKVTLPFTHTTPAYLINPCPGTTGLTCSPPHSFLHRLSLTDNVTLFKQVVSASNTTANRDATEGLFDGVMQVAVCGSKIGWRPKARRMLIYASDVDYHFAGDGKLAGIVRPHDFKCYLEPSDGFMKYTHDTILDYPSVGQIRKAVTDNNINTIFVIYGSAKTYYEKLNADIPGSFTEELTSNAANILAIIKSTYERLRSTVNFVNDPYKDITYEYWSACTLRLRDKTSECTNITVGTIITFQYRMNLTINKCPDSYSDRFDKTSIHPEGLEDRLDVNVEYICDCDCQSPAQAVENATECNNRGRYECGVCHCNKGWSGDTCECDISKTEAEACGNNTDVICGDRGKCRCGKCECDPDYTGDFCQCYNKDCPTVDGQLCAGNGICQCSVCKCYEGFGGADCNCPISTDACLTANGTLCSDHGTCECGKCKCTPPYRGVDCQDCPTCPGQCKSNQDCAECVGFKQGKLSIEDCAKMCSHVSTAEVLQVENVTRCQFFDDDGCQIEFTYEYNEDAKLKVVVKVTKTCPPGPPDATTLALGVSGAIFLVGLLLLLVWKILTSLLDTMEYKKFATEINDPKWGFEKNPIFKDPVTHYQNPVCDIPQGTDGDAQDGEDVIMRKK